MMPGFFETILRILFPPQVNSEADVERIHSLQLAATARRAEHAEKQAQADESGNPAHAGPQSVSWKKMKEAEAAHIAALQAWENKESRQRSR